MLFVVPKRASAGSRLYQRSRWSISSWLAVAKGLSGSALTARPATAAAPAKSGRSSIVSQSASGRQSSSVNATQRPRAAATPRLRAAAGPAFGRRSTRTAAPWPATSTGSRLPSSTTTTS